MSLASPVVRRIGFTSALAIALCLSTGLPTAAAQTKGTLTYKGKTLTLMHAYLVKGPDVIDADKVIRRLILTPTDIGQKLQACKTMSCTDADLTEGITVDLDGGPRLNYWVVHSDGLVQYSGTAETSALKASADEPRKLAGKLSFDATAANGPKVDVDFDAPLIKEVAAAH
jgi:hypothetical protein